MSINCLTYNHNDPEHFLLLPDERVLYKAPGSRISVHLNPINKTNNFESRESKNGQIFITNQRVVYSITDKTNKSVGFQDFVVLFDKNILKFKLVSTFFGTNKFEIIFKAVPSENGLNPLHVWQCLIYFNEGGITDFVNCFNKVYNESMYNQNDSEQLPAYSP